MQAKTEKSLECLGTIIHITIIHSLLEKKEIDQDIQKAFKECQRIESTYSRFLVNNELSQLNTSIGIWHTVSDELYFLIQQSEIIKQKTHGSFNIQVKRILDSLGYGSTKSTKDNSDTVYNISEDILLKDHNKIYLPSPIDLGGIGKGYALDRMKDILKKYKNLCINAGGDIFVQGNNHKQIGWKIAFEHPQDINIAIGEIQSQYGFFASSNALKRSWGNNQHHLIDPLTKKSAKNSLAVYTQGNNGYEVDAYATAIFALGFDQSQKILKTLPVEAMIISPHGQIIKTPKFQSSLFMN
jgi:FAD:protein FMN transferase